MQLDLYSIIYCKAISKGADMAEKAPDDEDEEIQQFKDFLCQEHRLSQSAAILASGVSGALGHIDNHPHLTPLEAPALEVALPVDSTEQPTTPQRSLLSTTSPCASLQPCGLSAFTTSAETSGFLGGGSQHPPGANDKPVAANVHLDSAYMLVSAGQLLHPK